MWWKNEKNLEILLKNDINIICVDEKCIGKYEFFTIFRDNDTKKLFILQEAKVVKFFTH